MDERRVAPIVGRARQAVEQVHRSREYGRVVRILHIHLVADGRPGTMPDVRGLSARDAMRALVKLGLSARVTGDGVVVSQEPPPGATLDEAGPCRLVLERKYVAVAAANQQ